MFTAFSPELVDLSSPNKATMGGVTVEGPGIAGALKRAVTSAAVRVFEKHGAGAFESSKESAAIHEAGHTVVGCLLGKRPRRVRIKQDQNSTFWLGMTECLEHPMLDTPAKLIKEARYTYAGVAAETIFDPDFRKGSSLDEVVMSQLVASQAAEALGVAPEPHWQAEVHYEVIRLLQEHRSMVKKIATYLFRYHKLKQPTLGRLLADGGAPR